MPAALTTGDAQSDVLGHPEAILALAIARMRLLAKEDPSREVSLAITNAEQALHWLGARKSPPNEAELRAKLLAWAERGTEK